MRIRNVCIVAACPCHVTGHGLCPMHKQRWFKAGKPNKAEWIAAGAPKPTEWRLMKARGVTAGSEQA